MHIVANVCSPTWLSTPRLRRPTGTRRAGDRAKILALADRAPARAAREGLLAHQDDYVFVPCSCGETAAVWRSIRLSGAPSATMARLSPPSRTESPSMNDEEQVPQARTPAAPADAGET